MSTEPMRALEGQLRANPPSGLEALAPEELRDLADAIRTARRRQAQALNHAADQALGHIPRLLRGPIRKIMG
jgi:hypothetical protein